MPGFSPKGQGSQGIYAPTPVPHWLRVLLEAMAPLPCGLSWATHALTASEDPWAEAGRCWCIWAYRPVTSRVGSGVAPILPPTPGPFLSRLLPPWAPAFLHQAHPKCKALSLSSLAEFSTPFQEAFASLIPSTCFRRDASKEPLLFLQSHHSAR